jgi:sec-independent protein translocase protein TatC
MLALFALWRIQGRILGRKLRAYIWWALLSGVVLGLSAFIYSERIILFLTAPSDGVLSPHDGKLVYHQLSDGFTASMYLGKIGFYIGFTPVMTVGLLSLLHDKLPRRWWWHITLFLASSTIAFVTGLVFFYYALLPVMIVFLLRWNSEAAVPLIGLLEYLREITQFGTMVAIMWVMPIAIFVLAKFSIITYRQLAFKRKYLIPGLLGFSVVITPSVSGELTYALFFPMYGLFEIGVFAAWLQHRHQGNYFADYFLVQLVVWLLKQILWRLPRRFALIAWDELRLFSRWAWARTVGRLIRRLR